MIDVAVRRALAAEPGVFATISGHQATVTALRDAHRELRHLPPATLGRLGAAGSARAREVVRVHRRVQSALAREWYDEADLLRLAAEHAAGRGPEAADGRASSRACGVAACPGAVAPPGRRR